MSSIKWIKLYTDIFDNRKIKQIEILPEGDSLLVIWLKLLVLAGNINDSGLIYFTKDIPYTDEMLAAQFGKPLNTVKLALNVFTSYGMIDIVDNLLQVSNWEKYQNIEGMEKVREQNRLRNIEYRKRQKEKLITTNVTHDGAVTSHDAIDIDIEEDKEIDIDNKKKNIKEKSDFDKAMDDFKELRKKLKKPLTDKAEQLIKKRLNELAPNDEAKQIKIINQSIMNGWQGVFELKEDNKKVYTQPTNQQTSNPFLQKLIQESN